VAVTAGVGVGPAGVAVGVTAGVAVGVAVGLPPCGVGVGVAPEGVGVAAAGVGVAPAGVGVAPGEVGAGVGVAFVCGAGELPPPEHAATAHVSTPENKMRRKRCIDGPFEATASRALARAACRGGASRREMCAASELQPARPRPG
jgi:hypothetical protein